MAGLLMHNCPPFPGPPPSQRHLYYLAFAKAYIQALSFSLHRIDRNRSLTVRLLKLNDVQPESSL